MPSGVVTWMSRSTSADQPSEMTISPTIEPPLALTRCSMSAAACRCASVRLIEGSTHIEPDVSSTSITAFGPVAAAAYHGRKRGSNCVGHHCIDGHCTIVPSP